jgi:hypothetical protein
MKTLQELLRDADPLGYEPRRSVEERRRSRQVILESPRTTEGLSRRSVALVVLALVLLVVATSARYWPGAMLDAVAAVRFEMRLAEETPAAGLEEVVIVGRDQALYLHPESVVTNSDISRAQVRPGATAAEFSVSISFNPEGAAKLMRATQSHLGRPVAILVDGEVVAAPVVRGPISTSAIVNGNFTRVEAERIAAGILGR